MRIKIVTK